VDVLELVEFEFALLLVGLGGFAELGGGCLCEEEGGAGVTVVKKYISKTARNWLFAKSMSTCVIYLDRRLLLLGLRVSSFI